MSESEPKTRNKPRRTQLTTSELAFVLNFTSIGTDTCGIQGKSAIKAGFSENTADKQASRMMRKPQIRAAIREVHQKMMDKAMINPAKVLANLENILDKALQKGDLAAANRATELQGKYLTMFGDRYVQEQSEEQQELTESMSLAADIFIELSNHYDSYIEAEFKRRIAGGEPRLAVPKDVIERDYPAGNMLSPNMKKLISEADQTGPVPFTNQEIING